MQIIGSGSPPPVGFQQPKNLYRFGETALWSTQLFAVNEVVANGSYRLFTTPRGQNGQGFNNTPMTIAETSIKEGGRVPSGAAYDVYGIACQLGFADGAAEATFKFDQPIDTSARIAQLLNLHNNGTLAWDFLQTIVDIAPVSVIGGGGGVFGSVATGNAVDSGHMNHGAGSIWLYRKHPVSLPGGSQFSVLLRFGSKAANIAAGNAAFAKVILFGFYKNVVEIG